MKTTEKSERVVEEYLRAVGKELSCPQKQKKALLSELKESASLFIAEHPEGTMDDLVQEFGEPKEIAHGFVSEAHPDDIASRLKLKRSIKFGICAVVGIVLVAAIITVVVRLVDFYENEEFRNGYFLETVSYGELVSDVSDTETDEEMESIDS